ncbi:MAG: chromosomal replication initiator protein DnaA [Canibacter sp.]
MSTSTEREIWARTAQIVLKDPEVGPAAAGQLGLAVPRGVAAHTMYLAVAHELTMQLLESRLRPAIMRAFAQIPEAHQIESFVVLVDPEVANEISHDDNDRDSRDEQQFREDQDVNAQDRYEHSETQLPSVQGTESSDWDSDGERMTSESAYDPFSEDDGYERARNPRHLRAVPRETDRDNFGQEPSQRRDRREDWNHERRSNDYREQTSDRRPERPIRATARHAGEKFGIEPRLNTKYGFDTFVIGQSNRFAHAAAVAVAEAPARAYNPLFIYGDSGLGKTHLLHAIGLYALELFPDIQVRYVSSEDFTNDFINSIANNQGAQFHSRYRSVDLLLVDDIQFLEGKAETQEAFFHTFNTLHDHNKQVVITSDVQPKQLRGFEDRMLSRFEWGLLTDIQAPDLETRIAILRKKAQREGLTVDDEILEFIATKFTSNIRELEGTLIRVTAFANLNKQPIDMNLVHTVLKDLISLNGDNEVQPGDIISETSEYFGISIDDLHGPGRSQQIALARQIAMYLCRELTPLSLPKIGQLFGGRDHTTVMYAHKKIANLIAEDRSTYNQVQELTSHIKQGK